MNKKLITLVASFALLTGCAVIRVGPPSKNTGSSGSALNSGGSHNCANNQYWDGTMCRHNGKGSGARKHDG